MKAVVSVMGIDRTGIIAKVSTKCAELGANIMEISQSVLKDYFAMIMVVDITDINVPFTQFVDEMKALGVKYVDLDTLFAESDIISLHCPLTAETEGLVDIEFLKKMKKSAYLINTSRGQVVDENALADALKNGIIAGAGLDVMTVEPPKADNPLFGLSNCHITPHIAWAGFETRERLMQIAKENVIAFLNENPKILFIKKVV